MPALPILFMAVAQPASAPSATWLKEVRSMARVTVPEAIPKSQREADADAARSGDAEKLYAQLRARALRSRAAGDWVRAVGLGLDVAVWGEESLPFPKDAELRAAFLARRPGNGLEYRRLAYLAVASGVIKAPNPGGDLNRGLRQALTKAYPFDFSVWRAAGLETANFATNEAELRRVADWWSGGPYPQEAPAPCYVRAKMALLTRLALLPVSSGKVGDAKRLEAAFAEWSRYPQTESFQPGMRKRIDALLTKLGLPTPA